MASTPATNADTFQKDNPMNRLLEQHVSLRPHTLDVWVKDIAEGWRNTSALLSLATQFLNREVADCTLWKEGERIPGSYNDKHPLYGALFRGSEEEVRKGFVRPTTFEDVRSPRSSPVQPYSLMAIKDKGLSIPSGKHSSSDPLELPYQALVEHLSLKEATHVFLSSGHPSFEQVNFAFPLVWGPQENVYLLFAVGTRYHETVAFFFQGDLLLYAEHFRPSSRTWEERKDTQPVLLPHLLISTPTIPHSFRAPALRDVQEAMLELRRRSDENGKPLLENL